MASVVPQPSRGQPVASDVQFDKFTADISARRLGHIQIGEIQGIVNLWRELRKAIEEARLVTVKPAEMMIEESRPLGFALRLALASRLEQTGSAPALRES